MTGYAITAQLIVRLLTKTATAFATILQQPVPVGWDMSMRTATVFATILQQAVHAEPAAGGDTVNAADAEDVEDKMVLF